MYNLDNPQAMVLRTSTHIWKSKPTPPSMAITHSFLPVFSICLITLLCQVLSFTSISNSNSFSSTSLRRATTTDEEDHLDGKASCLDSLSRRAFFSASAVSVALAGHTINESAFAQVMGSPAVLNSTVPAPSQKVQPPHRTTKSIEPIDIQKVARENKINITVYENENTKVYINSTSFYKMKERIFPPWIPSFLLPKIKPEPYWKITDAELLMASAIAGSFTEVVRSGILYPITTIKTRIQASTPSDQSTSFREMLRTFAKSIVIQTKTGDLYAGFLPSMIIGVPASGVYYGVRDVMLREIRQFTAFDELSVILAAVLVADVVSLAFRTPALLFSVRSQAVKAVDAETVDDYDEDGNLVNVLDIDTGLDIEEEPTVQDDANEEDDWWAEFLKDWIRQLPVIIITDLPYLAVKISFLRAIAHGNESILEYDVLNIFAAIVASGLTTPFDVARTRILVDSDRDPVNGLDGGSGEGIFEAMKRISNENVEGGTKGKVRLENLYAGWFERVFYFGIGIAWLEPIRIICYNGLRDILLLEVFS